MKKITGFLITLLLTLQPQVPETQVVLFKRKG